ncbi:Major Facilitator Superfamily protein [Clostridium sp. USBA 49]|uniref:MFS transporter n=1 Tax=Clostridium sp. USBA 49 TaxID=1881060 RepID=UPI0009992425|nr:MFS transporter [Clostridium sp. USBA 49]SKA83046.1 Major Facilitator Superfamily protein [Clostridium sp. USBA 49]
MSKSNKVIKFFYLYAVFSNLLLFLPVLLMIYTKRNITSSDMLLIEACYYFTIFLFEIPTGFIGDKIGHDKLVVLGLIGTTVSYVIFAFSFNLVMIIISQVLLGIFGSCISGSDYSSLATYLEKKGEKDGMEYQNKLYRLTTIGTLISFVFSGIVYKLDSKGKLTFLITACTYLLSTIAYIVFVVYKKKSIGDIENESINEEEKTFSISTFESTSIDKDVIICGVLIGILSGSYVVSQIFYNNLKIDAYYIGVLYCLSNVVTIIFNKLNFKFNKTLMFLMPLMYLTTIFNNKIALFLFILIVSLIKSKVKPFINNYVLTHSKNNKAYNMSFVSFIYNIMNAIFMVSLSRIIYFFGFKVGMIGITILTFLLLIYLYEKSSTSYKMELMKEM